MAGSGAGSRGTTLLGPGPQAGTPSIRSLQPGLLGPRAWLAGVAFLPAAPG
jgi:hypothetical protein